MSLCRFVFISIELSSRDDAGIIAVHSWEVVISVSQKLIASFKECRESYRDHLFYLSNLEVADKLFKKILALFLIVSQ